MKQRLDQALVERNLVSTRSQAESYIKLGHVKLNGQIVTKPGQIVHETDKLQMKVGEQYVSRAGHKLASVTAEFGLDFHDKTVLDVGSSTGGFTDYALRNGAKKVIAIELGTNQLHPTLRGNPNIELHEQTDIRNYQKPEGTDINIIVIDVSFVSLRDILPAVNKLANQTTQIIAMVKPQFEAKQSSLKHKGVIKNEKIRREILKEFESWVRQDFVVKNKADSKISGEKGNLERFYLLQNPKD